MIRKILFLIILCSALNAQAKDKKVAFDLVGVSVQQVMQVIFTDALKTPYVLDPEITGDARIVSFRWSSEKGDIKIFLNKFLSSLGYAIENKNGTDYVGKKKEGDEAPKEIYVYKPKYRDSNFLIEILSPLFKYGNFTNSRAVSAPPQAQVKQDSSPPPSSATALIEHKTDLLVFNGRTEDIEKLKKVLPDVDVAVAEVMVRGIVYEVSSSENEGSAFGILTTLLGSKLQLGIGSVISTAASGFIHFKTGNFEVLYNILSNDSRFKVVSSPSLRIKSGSTGSLTVGEDVPILSSVSYPNNGQPVQSVTYKSSGMLFDISPTVWQEVIDVTVNQQISSFATTTTGVNNSPTLTKREVKTSLGMKDGDLIIMGGLTQNRQSDTRDGLSFLPKFLHTTGKSSDKTEILLVLQVSKI